VRALLATGSSARSVREQLYLNGRYFLSEKGDVQFIENMPELRWFQTQREGLGNESLMYSFIRIAKCEEIVQWGFDETSLNGVPTMNQWCRIKEGDVYKIVTLECAGLLTGSTATRVSEHIKVVWQRGQHAINMLRTALGETCDTFVPVVNGGVSITKLRGAMHDTCNCANLVAKKVRILRDDAGKDMYGQEEWAAMQESGSGWQEFLCGNHSRNLHFDAFNRQYTQYIKGLLGEDMSRASLKGRGRLRIEPDGESLLRAICKLTHTGPKQYEKGNHPYPNPYPHPDPNPEPHPNPYPNPRGWHCLP
jgi:hypothetical protein